MPPRPVKALGAHTDNDGQKGLPALHSTATDDDLEEIFDYTLGEFGLDQAIKYVSEFELLFEQLVKSPEMGKARNEIKPGLKSFPKASHIVFYRALKDHIWIVSILHGSRDIPKFFD